MWGTGKGRHRLKKDFVVATLLHINAYKWSAQQMYKATVVDLNIGLGRDLDGLDR